MRKYLRIAVTALSLTACVLLVALWVRSHWKSDIVFHVDSKLDLTTFGSNHGTVYFSRMSPPRTIVADGENWAWPLRPHRWRLASNEVTVLKDSFRWQFNRHQTYIQVPNFLVLCVIALVSAVLWLRWRFTLRTLLIAMTLVAVVLGIVVAAR